MKTVYSNDFIDSKRFIEITNQFSKLNSILVIGDIGIDKYTLGAVNKISPEAPVPILEVEKEWHKLGLAANISHNLKALGVSSDLCGLVGTDGPSKIFKKLLEENNISSQFIVESPERPTIFKERVVTNTQQICRIDYENKMPLTVNESQLVNKLIDANIKKFDAIILEDYAKGFVTQKEANYIIKSAKDKGSFLAVDPGRTTPPQYYKGADLLKPNLLEAKTMVKALGYNENIELDEIAEILIDKLKISKLVITLGSEGMALVDTEDKNVELKIIPTVANEVFDVSGAGDTSIAILIASISAGAGLEEAAWISNCGAGVVVAKRGTATVSLSELVQYHKELKSKFS